MKAPGPIDKDVAAAVEASKLAAAKAPALTAAPAASKAAPAAKTAAAKPAAAPAKKLAAAPSTHQAGEKLYKSACVACHSTGVANAPKLGDKAAWAPRLAEGEEQIMEIAFKGKGAMPPRGASSADDATLKAAVEYMLSTVQ
ncbi:c-type cytochrome [Allopusillimonas ginsengisoli]|uniref:c-type cytochrome n=1 Tax=Allopusillimonas ginsengisoli TaxID=453575 RepID=UPI0039C27172